MPTQNDRNLIWIDLEMTGLIPETHTIVEIATIVTDPELNQLAEGPVFAISQPASELNKMDPFVRNMHTRSGLLQRIQSSNVSLAQAEHATIEFLAQYVPAGKSPVCGNGICMDKRFLSVHMPNLCNYFHYRQIDVSTLKELATRWKPDIMSGVVKKGKHLALEDIRESIEELKYYRTHFLKR